MQEFYSNIHFTSIWWALFFPIVLIILDIFTGVVNAWKNNDFQSSIMRAGLSKKFGEIVYILVGILTKFAIGTDLILYFLVDNAFILTDLPGYGYAKADRSTIEGFNQLTDDYLTSDRPMKLVLFLLDARHKPSENDEMMFEFLNEIGLPYVVVLTKTDKMSRSQLLQRVREFRKLDYIGEEGAVFPISSSKKSGLEDLKVFLGEYIGNINDQ